MFYVCYFCHVFWRFQNYHLNVFSYICGSWLSLGMENGANSSRLINRNWFASEHSTRRSASGPAGRLPSKMHRRPTYLQVIYGRTFNPFYSVSNAANYDCVQETTQSYQQLQIHRTSTSLLNLLKHANAVVRRRPINLRNQRHHVCIVKDAAGFAID